MADVIVVGSGPGGVSATLGLVRNGIDVEVLDGGSHPLETEPIDQNLYDFCEHEDAFDLLLGRVPRLSTKYLPSRLMAPRFSFVLSGAEEFLPSVEFGFSAAQTLATGGLANAWGAGCYRYTDDDLSGYPISLSELNPYYDALTTEIGISGQLDDLQGDFGPDLGLLPPLQLSQNASRLLRTYRLRHQAFARAEIRLGRARLAILSQAHNGRTAHRYQNLEFWQPRLSSVYTPAYTLERLARNRQVILTSNVVVHRFERKGESILVHGVDRATREPLMRTCRLLVLAAGAINSARISLKSNNDSQSCLRLLDNAALQIPFVIPGRIGCALDRDALGSVQLNMVYRGIDGQVLQSSLLDLSSPARAEFFGRFPLSSAANLSMIRYLLPAMMVNLVFFPSDEATSASIRLTAEGSIEISGPHQPHRVASETLAGLIRGVRLLGGLTHASLASNVPAGGGVHYAGTLPMKSSPIERYHCSAEGELVSQPGVFVADGAVLPKLAAKNHTFTLMANAMRIGEIAAKRIGKRPVWS